MKPTAVLLLAAVLLPGCKSTLNVSNQSDPKSFEPIPLPGNGYTGPAYAELVYDVPEEVSDGEFDIVRADIFGEVFIEEAAPGEALIEVDIYIGLEPGGANLDDPAVNGLLATIELDGSGARHAVALTNPPLLREGLAGGRFYVKVDAEIIANPAPPSDPELGILRITGIYFDAFLEKDTSGLLSLLYIF